jgi:hypothetical protein
MLLLPKLYKPAGKIADLHASSIDALLKKFYANCLQQQNCLLQIICVSGTVDLTVFRGGCFHAEKGDVQ